jgi:hypothetical protein
VTTLLEHVYDLGEFSSEFARHQALTKNAESHKQMKAEYS